MVLRTRPCFLLTHLGLGDLVMSIPMIHFLLEHIVSVKLVIKECYYKSFSDFFRNNPRVEYYVVRDDADISPVYGADMHILETLSATYDILLCGSHVFAVGATPHSYSIIPFNFYNDAHIAPNIFWTHSNIVESPESQALYDSLITSQQPYIIIHATYSGGDLFSVADVERHFNINRNTTLILDFSKNHYDSAHPYYEKAQRCIMKPLTHYITLFNRAPRLVLSDSCLFCLALQLPLTTDECYVVPRGEITYTHIYEPKYGYNPVIHRQRRFKTLKFTPNC